MYKISIWLKGGGKIIEECDINKNSALRIYENATDKLLNGSTLGFLKINRNPIDEFPVIICYKDIAGIEIEEGKKKEYTGRKLETRNN
jgi:hypothetical protein